MVRTLDAVNPLLVELAARSSKKETILGSEFSPAINCSAVRAGVYPAVSTYRSSANDLLCRVLHHMYECVTGARQK